MIFDRETGEVIRCSVPTALENVANGKGRFVHGASGEPMKAAPKPAPEPEPVIELQQEGVLDLPAADAEPTPEPSDEAKFNGADPAKFDHDGDKKPGGAPKGGNVKRTGLVGRRK